MHTLFSTGRHDHYYYYYTQLLELCLNGHNLVSFEATISRFFMVIDLNDTYRMMMTLMMMKIQIGQYLWFRLQNISYGRLGLHQIWMWQCLLQYMVWESLKCMVLSVPSKMFHSGNITCPCSYARWPCQ